MSEKENLEQLCPCDMDQPFLFISYSSLDGDRVTEDALELQKRGFNVWIDNKNLDKTKSSWKLDALEAIRDYNCAMLIFYVSSNSLTSKFCFDEVMETMSEETCEIHLGPVPMICIDAEDIGNINEAVRRIGENIRTSDRDKTRKAEQTRVLSQFEKKLFHSNNERVRIHPKDEANRKSDYYTDIISSLPDQTRCFAYSRPAMTSPETQPPAMPPKAAPSAVKEAVLQDSPEDAKKRVNGDLVRIGDFDVEHGFLKTYYGTEKNIKIPDEAKIIGSQSFGESQKFLESVDLNQAGSILGSAFFNCPNLHTVIVPATVTMIKADAFRFCPNLVLHVRKRQLPEGFETTFQGKDIVYIDE
ncbi:MAG: leucine-rich repeat protein [Solobacterium sp.]|nr:leucine-rich repeat protein [Solobacterium sp.]